jgi:Mrp family chromosome partitioning ATPase
MDIKQVMYPEPRQIAGPAGPPPAAPTQARKAGFPVDVLQSLRIHALAATVVALLTLGLGIALLIRHGVTYAATSVVYVSPTVPATLTPDRETDYPEYESYIEEQMHSVIRYDVLAEALRRMKPGEWQHPGESEQSAVLRLARALTVARDGMTYQMDISIIDKHPENLADIVNTVTNVYLEKTKNEEYFGLNDRLATLKQTREQVQNELNADMAQEDKISQQLGVAVVGGGGDDSSDQLDTQVAKVRSDLIDANEDKIKAQAQLSSLENANPNVPNPALDEAANEMIANDPSLTSFKNSMNERRATLMAQEAGMTENNAVRKQIDAEVTDIDANLQKFQTNLRTKAAAQLKQKLRTELNRAGTVEGKLQGELHQSTSQAVSSAPDYQRAQQLQVQIKNLQTWGATLDERTRNLELDNDSPGSVHMFAAARPPFGPLKSKAMLFAVLLLPFACVMGVGTAVTLDLLDPRVYSPRDIEQVLGFSPIGAIFDESEVTLHAYDECTLRMAAGIDQAARSAGVRTIVLTGVHTGAGTTSVIEDLGSTLAKLGRKTLTIDASGLTAPVAYLTIGLNRTTQKADGGRTGQEGPQQTSVIAQPFGPQLTPLTSFMDQAFKDLTSEYELVLIDATPLLISAETEYLARFADVTILIAESGKTKKARLRRAAVLLERLNVRGIAAVVNKIGLERASRATQRDLEEFEAHVNRMNLRWRPASPATKAGKGPEAVEPQQENHTYA